ncbi:AraC family transcriptional regulator ligand-binding domain-containing protein [Zavarzinia sp. CC-PAN008]|uniref:AraC family transcriptional regulator n=1 Tax=Zavarzinia sp. CC-PAN008 TaxID=3243332 RepID=UPI003F74956D
MSAMIRAGALRGFAGLVERLGQDPRQLMQRVGLAPDLLRDEDAFIPLRSVVAALEAAATACDCPDFGLRLAQEQTITTLGPLALALQASTTVADGVQVAARYLFTHSPASRVSAVALEEDPDLTEIRLELLLPRIGPARQFRDLGLALTDRLLRLALGGAYRPRLIRLPHVPLAPAARYRQHFGAPVIFEQDAAGIQVDASLLKFLVNAPDARMRQAVASYLDQHFPAPGLSAAARTRTALDHALGRASLTLEDIARAMGAHPRTVQRQLQAEGTSFERLRDQARRDAALRYLENTRLPLVQVSGLLGLAEQSALSRLCRRWFGKAPRTVRREAQGS